MPLSNIVKTRHDTAKNSISNSITALTSRQPAAWRLLRAPVRRYFDRRAAGWDRRAGVASPDYLAALDVAAASLPVAPGRILDVGTGTGAAALQLARRYPQAEIVGIDISGAMIAAARAKLTRELAGRVAFRVADAAELPPDLAGFDLVAQVNVPVFFDSIAHSLAPAGHAVIISGSAIPGTSPHKGLERGFARRGCMKVAAGEAGRDHYFVARRTPAPTIVKTMNEELG